ncbi:MAG: glycosyltransferase 87 family protein, partial [Streptosporangiaceae bacterium]
MGLQFTYTPFAAVAFAVLSLLGWQSLTVLTAAASLLALAGTCWLTAGMLGYRSAARAGAALLAAGVLLWTEPVQRTLFLGQVNLVLLLLIMADLCAAGRPDGPWRKRTWWAGAGIGIAAGIKLTPLIFI